MWRRGKRVYLTDNAEVECYLFLFVPTEQVKDPKNLPSDERLIYDLIVRRVIAAHYPAAVFDYSTITTLVDERAAFISKGKQLIKSGWRQVIVQKEEKDVILPSLEKGESGKVQKVEVKSGKTQPPKRYTEGQLITLMKTAGKYLDNEELEKVLKKTEGLGTEATRASIITMLKDRKYIEVTKNQVFALDKAKVLIGAIGDEILASPEMTAKWEQRLADIGEGKASPLQFIEQTKKLAGKIIEDAVHNEPDWDFSRYNTDSIQRLQSKYTVGKKVGSCPLCSGDIVDKGEFYGCVNYKKSNCKFTISKKILGKKISAANLKKLLTAGKTELIKGFKKGDQAFNARLSLDETKNKLQFLFEK